MLKTAPSAPSIDDPIPADLREIVALFHGPLAKTPFPDVDAASLEQYVDAVHDAASKLAVARAAVDLASARLGERVAALGATAKRGLAYARIYADAHPEHGELTRALADLRPGSASGTAPGARRRGRPPKSASPADVPAMLQCDEHAAE